jgi:hypothetical protein
MAVFYVGDNGPDGASFGTSSTELISFYGATPIAQRSGAPQAALSNSAYVLLSATPASAGGTWGLASSTQIVQLIANVIELQNRSSAAIVLTNELRAALVALGAIAGA